MGKRNAPYSLRDDTSISIKEADKGSGVVVWDKEDYLVEVKKQLDDKDVYQELRGDVEGPLEKIIKKVIRKLRNRGDISHETLDYFSVNNPKLGRFYLLPKIHKRFYDVSGRPVISNSEFYTEIFVYYRYVLCTIDAVDLYPNVLHDEGLIAMRKALYLGKDKRISTESLTEF